MYHLLPPSTHHYTLFTILSLFLYHPPTSLVTPCHFWCYIDLFPLLSFPVHHTVSLPSPLLTIPPHCPPFFKVPCPFFASPITSSFIIVPITILSFLFIHSHLSLFSVIINSIFTVSISLRHHLLHSPVSLYYSPSLLLAFYCCFISLILTLQVSFLESPARILTTLHLSWAPFTSRMDFKKSVICATYSAHLTHEIDRFPFNRTAE